jgi:hypothetical protein
VPKVDLAFLADAAEAEPGRKFYVLGGGVDSINAPSFPVVHPHLSLVLRLMIHPTEADREHALEVRMIDADGRALANITGTFTAAGAGAAGREIPANLVFNMVNTRFESAGDYSIEILINNEHKKSLPLRVVQVG